jgi:hypothetical protein
MSSPTNSHSYSARHAARPPFAQLWARPIRGWLPVEAQVAAASTPGARSSARARNRADASAGRIGTNRMVATRGAVGRVRLPLSEGKRQGVLVADAFGSGEAIAGALAPAERSYVANSIARHEVAG